MGLLYAQVGNSGLLGNKGECISVANRIYGESNGVGYNTKLLHLLHKSLFLPIS